jgi:hypothetical protein
MVKQAHIFPFVYFGLLLGWKQTMFINVRATTTYIIRKILTTFVSPTYKVVPLQCHYDDDKAFFPLNISIFYWVENIMFINVEKMAIYTIYENVLYSLFFLIAMSLSWRWRIFFFEYFGLLLGWKHRVPKCYSNTNIHILKGIH